MQDKLKDIKMWLSTHRQVYLIVCIIFVLLIALPIIKDVIETSTNNNNEVQEQKVELTRDQENLISNYSTEISNNNAFLENSLWTNNAGEGSLKFEKNQIIEIKDGKESIVKYAICSSSKEETKTGDFPPSMKMYEYTMSVLLDNGKYKSFKLSKVINGNSEEDEIYGSKIESDNLFKNNKTYIRVTNSPDFNISNWDENANQFIDGKYNDLFKLLKDYCYKNYPITKDLDWSGEVSINYFNKSVSLSFYVDKKSTKIINVLYNQQSKQFEITKKYK